MCLILVAWRVHAEFPLVVAANRDEYFARPTRSAGFWPEAPQMLAGRDLTAGGTWLGITRSGRFAALTNYRDPRRQKSAAPSRGHLVSGFLEGTSSAADYVSGIARNGTRYNGFNLLAGDGAGLWCYNNINSSSQQLEPGVHGLSNHLLNTPWPKVEQARLAISTALARLPDESGMFEFLRNDTMAADDDLPETGVTLEWERRLSAVFVRGTDYGTRNSTMLTINRTGRVSFDEQEWNANASAARRQRYVFSIDPQIYGH